MCECPIRVNTTDYGGIIRMENTHIVLNEFIIYRYLHLNQTTERVKQLYLVRDNLYERIFGSTPTNKTNVKLTVKSN